MPSRLRDVFERVRVREGAQLLQRLVLDLPDPLPRDVERPAHFVERARMLSVQPVPELEHAAFAVRKRAEDLLQRFLAHRDLGGLVGQRHVLVGEEVPELRLLLVPDRLLERHGRLRAPHDLLDLLERQIEVHRDLDRQRLAAELRTQLPLRADDLVQLLHDVYRHADRARFVGEGTCDRLTDPPRRVRRELEPLAVVELLGCAHETDRALLDQIEERQPLVPIALRDRDDEAEIRLHHLLLRRMVAALDALRELDLLRRSQEVHPADVLQEELERVRRDLARLGRRGLFLLFLVDNADNVDLQLLESAVEVVDLPSVEIELVECERYLVLGNRACRLRRLEQSTGLYRFEEIGHGRGPSFNPSAHLFPLLLERCRTMPAGKDTAL